jgi:hypothetical protein
VALRLLLAILDEQNQMWRLTAIVLSAAAAAASYS